MLVTIPQTSVTNPTVLLAEDNPTTAAFLRLQFERAGFSVMTAYDGQLALDYWSAENFDVIIIDWMLPVVDGVELLRTIRASKKKSQPVVVVHTSLASDNARSYSLEMGADEYFAKPAEPATIIDRVNEILSERKTTPQHEEQIKQNTEPQQKSSDTRNGVLVQQRDTTALRARKTDDALIAVTVAASTGGPVTLGNLLSSIPMLDTVAIFVVLHGPAWMMPSFAERIERNCKYRVRVAEAGMHIEHGTVYIAPGDFHMTVSKAMTIDLLDTPKENFVRPAADPLFRSVADVFGKRSIAIQLTGLGTDGMKGCKEISSAGGTVFVQDPATAVAPPMPSSVIAAGIPCTVLPVQSIAAAVQKHVDALG
ncbi:MAG: response regulator [Candidatus Kapabacteria bacterium]|nr:response regulator [Candidatus Kapabacteria bacterium]